MPDLLTIEVDKYAPVPLYFQVARQLEEAIREGQLPPGSRIETEIALSERLGISRPTIRRAIQELVDRGLLVRRRGIGTQVVHGRISRNVEFTSLQEDLESGNRTPQTTVLSVEARSADSTVAELLNVPKGSPVVHLRRLRFADGVPLAILENTLPGQISDIDLEVITREGLYKFLRSRGVVMRVAKQKIGAREATIEQAELLEVPEGSALLTMERTAFDDSGRAAEHGNHCYRPDMYSFEITLTAS
jgi:DNA-binding GntR family transcriptional regulator